MEIELKFTLSSANVNTAKQAISNAPYHVNSKTTLTLSNAYYDTTDNQLREWDFGLRTRTTTTEDGQTAAEQTIKLSGADVGGLQQRPEYTVEIPLGDSGAAFANLALFSPSIFPSDFQLEPINKHLHKVFETTFERQVWDIELNNGALIECVLDQGSVEAEFEDELKTEAICEIEFELKQGSIQDLFEVAFYLINKVPTKLGLLSKAARGYHLAQGKKLIAINLESIEYSGKALLEPEMIKIFGYAIEFIQHNELVFEQDKKTKSYRRIMDGISLIIQTLELFKPYLPETRCQYFIDKFMRLRKQARWIEPFYQFEKLNSRKSPYRKDIENSESLLALFSQRRMPEEKIEEALLEFTSKEFNQIFLSFTQWLSLKGWRNEMSLTNVSNLTMPIKPIAEQWLDNAWIELKSKIKSLDLNSELRELEKVYWSLAAGLLTGVAISGLYPGDNRLAFRSHLLNLMQGVEEGILLHKLQKLLDEESVNIDSSIKQEDLASNLKWIKAKKNSLNMAVTASIEAVLKLKPYW